MPNSLKRSSDAVQKWISPGPVAASVAGVAVCTLTVLLCLNLLLGLQMGWGTVATWANSIASTGVLIGVALMTRTQAVASELTAARLRANGVRVCCENAADPPHWLITIENRSKDAIYRIELSGFAVKTPKGDGAVLENVWFDLGDADRTAVEDGENFVYKAMTAADPAKACTHHGLPGVAWTAATGHRFRSVYPLTSGVPDLSPRWEFVEMDTSHGRPGRALRP